MYFPSNISVFLCAVSWTLLFISFENWEDVPNTNENKCAVKCAVVAVNLFKKFPFKYIPAIW